MPEWCKHNFAQFKALGHTLIIPLCLLGAKCNKNVLILLFSVFGLTESKLFNQDWKYLDTV